MKICPSCNKKCADSIKYCPGCNRYLGNMQSVSEEEYYKETRATNQLNNQITIECPYCHSTNTHKIPLLSKAITMTLLGNFAIGEVSKNFHCNKCGADF